MSGGMQVISLRLSVEDQARLDVAAARLKLDRTKTMRRLIRDAAQLGPLPRHGYFTPVTCSRKFRPISIRLSLGGR
ncbi:MAG: hypothetical protein IPK52_21835 [Chloroflexi bacterium]|nr:hypothetical protein [Chloroflexota bacterium]